MNQARLHELLADRALDALEAADARELERALDARPELDEHGFEEAAAAVLLAHAKPTPLPAALRARLGDAGARWARERKHELAERSGAQGKPAMTERVEEPHRAYPGRAPELALAPPPLERTRDVPLRGPRRASALPWFVAAAAVVVALLGWLRQAPPLLVPPPADAALARAQLLREAPDVQRLEWSATADPAARGASGDVVWSDARQEGYLRLVGLAANDPRREQYQLWIFDRAQSEATPIDGGVFDVRAEEVVLPIDAKLPVVDAYAFAVTLERPGGVVVSDRSRVALAAGL